MDVHSRDPTDGATGLGLTVDAGNQALARVVTAVSCLHLFRLLASVLEGMVRGTLPRQWILLPMPRMKMPSAGMSTMMPFAAVAMVPGAQGSVEDVGRKVENEDLAEVKRCLYLRALAAMDDHITRTQGWLRGEAGDMVRSTSRPGARSSVHYCARLRCMPAGVRDG